MELQRELSQPVTVWGRRYMATLIVTIILSVFYLFIQDEFPLALPMGSLRLLAIELFILVVFSADFLLRLLVAKKDKREILFLAIDFLAILPSVIVVLQYTGLITDNGFEYLALLRLMRLSRILKLLRMQNAVVDIFGASVLTLVFGVMALHLGLRVFLLELTEVFGVSIEDYFDRNILMIAVTAVGSVFGIALAITFGIAKRKQIEISELHRLALDALDAIEADIERLKPDNTWKGSQVWRDSIDQFLNEEVSYPEMKSRTRVLLSDVRAQIIDRPSLDVPFHNNLVARVSQFLTKTQIEFHPVFYKWLNRIAQLYFVLVLLAAPGLTGVFVQLMVIFVFQGLVVIIDDMDHAVDTEVTLFNSKILEV
ncbi:ion transporter [Roseovarius sp. EL26]|uniref:ion transporter n=1 Tax=Roseovarius sp. EL26 TaxID=2126672 RepID=UPI0013C4FDB9|nr:ion transporter [Roseovarius sp. EL26]